ncbi:MAG: transcription antitermination factor NusB [Cytophagaceae bacterium]|nr:transcription antitermination factor NusB [Cytophagaceae bacterium]
MSELHILMLNRRTLRIKALQSLYAIRQAESANYQLALDSIKETFEPDLNAMVRQDSQRLEGLRQLATLTFQEQTQQKPVTDEEIPLEARRAVSDATVFNRERNRQDRQRLVKMALDEVERIYDQYLLVLLLLIELGDEAALSDERRMTDQPDDLHAVSFSRNVIIDALRDLKPLHTDAIRRDLAWSDDDRKMLIRPFFREIVRTDPAFAGYCRKGSHSFEEDMNLAQHVLKTLIFKNEPWQTYFDEADLHWEENRDIVRSLSLKTLKSLEEGENPAGKMALQTLSPNWEDDRVFFQDLLRISLDKAEEYETLVREQIQNWEIDRLALTDRLLLTLALAELLNFPGIPVKVTLNEFIEVAKLYSTPKSGQFLNGILDVLAIKLKENGTLRKSGRGLIDNR